MKKVFISLSLPAFFSLGYELSAYTRAELIQDRLSKIGIKQDVIDETIKFEYDIKDEKNFFTEDGQENDNLLKLKEIYQKDERNETLGGVLVGAYIVGGKKDFKKAREYMDKMFIETLGDYLAEEDDKTNKEANDLPDGFLYDDKKGIIENKEKNNDSDKEEENLEDTQTYSESVKEILDNGKQTLDSQKQEISKYERIINYFKIPKNQKKFGIPDDYIRGFKLKIAEVKIAKNMMNYGIENAVKYYLDNVSTNDVSYEDVYFNEQSELALYLAVAQMLSVADENVMNKYRKEFENTRVIKLLDEILKNERKNQKSDKPQQEIRNNIKS